MDGAGLLVTVLLPPARENVELTTLYLLTPGNGCKKVSSAFCLSCIPPLGYREIRLFSSLLLARLFFPPPPPFPSFLPRNSLPSSLFLFRFFFLSGRRGGGGGGTNTRSFLPSFFFHPSRTVKGEVSEVSEGGIRTPRTLRLRHLPSPLPSPLACKGKDGRIPIGSLE